MWDAVRFLIPPLVACTTILGLLCYLGMHVLRREIIFIDIALAQIAAVGATFAHVYLGTEEHSLLAYLCAFGFTVLASLFFSQGTPMLLAGDEFGNGQDGNNNAYAQDNETGWVDWSGLRDDPGFQQAVRQLIRLRKDLPLLRQARYIHGRMPTDSGWCDISWLHPDGRPMLPEDWNGTHQLALLFSSHEDQKDESPIVEAVALLFNGSTEDLAFSLPEDLPPNMKLRFSSAPDNGRDGVSGPWSVAARSLLLLTGELES